MAKRRYNIGLLVASLTDAFSNRIAAGAMEAAKQLDANMVIFPGKYVGVQHINEQYGAKYEYQYNTLFNLAAEAKLDYLIVAVGTIAYAHNYEYQREFLKSLGDTPILSVAAEIEGYDYLLFDNRSGVSDAVDFLASSGRKHIGMMAGNLNNDEFVQRYEAYRQGLEANGLAFKDSYVMTSEFNADCTREVEQLLDGNPELDAIVCAADLLAASVYEALKKRLLHVGIDVAVVGFDDLPFAAKLDPPLASVRADAMLLGKRAVEKAVNYLNGVRDDCHYLESQFILRQSCFKVTDSVAISRRAFSGEFPAMIDYVRSFLAKRLEMATVGRDSCDLIVKLLEDIYENYVQRPVDERNVADTLAMLDRAMPLKEDPEIDRILDGAYIWFLRNCPLDSVPYIQMLHQYFRADKNEGTVEDVVNKFRDRTHLNNIFIRDALMFSGNLKDSYARILKRMENVGAMTAFIYTYEKPIIHRLGDPFPSNPAWQFQSYCYGNEVFSLSQDERILSTPEVFDNKYLGADRQHVFIVADLYSAEMQYGVALLEPRDQGFFDELEMVTFQLSSAVRTLDMLKQQEKLLEELNIRNLALDEMSKIDALTELYNRRGFYPAADELINDPRYQGKPFIVCYVDLDNLKMVNDTYGHAEGDFSIRLVADCLAHILGEGAVIGRMGGDEFAAIVPAGAGATVETLIRRKDQFVENFNRSKEKPYEFGMSIGAVESLCDNTYDLRAALAKADDRLYIEKSKKKKQG